MEKIQMKTPLVEMDGDEMTRILWKLIKQILLEPYIDLKTDYYDLGLKHRDETEDKVTVDAAEATKKYGVGVKCATITPNSARMKEYNLHQMWKSPNGTIRAILDGTVFRAPVLVKGVTPFIPTWKRPITIARHAYGDLYKNVELSVPAGAKAELVVTDKDGKETRRTIHDFDGAGIVQGLHNLDGSIASFAQACFNYALATHQDLWFAAKDTISKIYDHRFKDIFQEIYEKEYQKKFEKAGITYFYTLIDDAVARVIRSNGGFIWACKNYDGDVMSDMVATAFGSLAMMTSVLVSPTGEYEYEAAHGTVQRHYYKYLKGEPTSTNSIATLFAWTGALRKRGELDCLPNLMSFAGKLEKAAIQTIEDGIMTGDMYRLSTLRNKKKVGTEEFLQEINVHLQELLQA
ncbi:MULTISPECIES: NADP-dependent isocitrate dehydrogenase [Caproicibacterium]|jgi:isocitrate dehydrogenase|uniref:Isocitrate dehydrogenase [NADP] n=1 Tax=Caproicibacterium lactatifermentans TaxID=2666138 RepID=A0A859DUY2_9FIRM|nr:NADP-dependent isocitrate dehydrogenase [Caproicibacterium lactatifermentans]ARP50437.1 isocitrate dehydrogenase [Ruminococcaceae bacterium CPB6]MDD4807276.1 NADP-dependent isocitrate dehydrogenase [Oscillospiraceae bacterium]QKN23841.1 NADP-dependent isocitrate dehydrogenase [Caproicibacterium lactatifermentans]QKO31087.1 NADP-dependent isocitrate dehydrogenase [Caproicibacterium lactatifermentans]